MHALIPGKAGLLDVGCLILSTAGHGLTSAWICCAVLQDPQDGGLTSLVDTEGVNTAIQDLMREGNPFDELDRVSGRVRQRIHTQNDK